MEYVTGDIHGNKDKWDQLLKLICLGRDDILYVNGDAIDRGPDGIEILQEIKNIPNTRMLLGNHEHMMLQYYAPGDDTQTISNWMRNGGRRTYHTFRKLPEDEQQELLAWLRSLPTHLEITVNGQTFYLVHGWPSTEPRREVWGRPRGISDKSLLVPQGARLIIGHTPVGLVTCETEGEMDFYFRKLEQTGAHMLILHAPDFIDLDCGCGHHVPGTALGCLRLDDMAEFYV